MLLYLLILIFLRPFVSLFVLNLLPLGTIPIDIRKDWPASKSFFFYVRNLIYVPFAQTCAPACAPTITAYPIAFLGHPIRPATCDLCHFFRFESFHFFKVFHFSISFY